MIDLLYRWPAAARFGRQVPKEKLYQQIKIATPVREKFVSEVRRITWTHKLAETTINLRSSQAVPEIEVFQIEAKGSEVSEQVLTAIDKAILFPLIFEISRNSDGNRQIRMVAAYKQLGIGAPKLSAYYSTDWQPADVERQPLPTAINLSVLYKALLEPLTPVAVRPDEETSDLIARLQTVRKLEREITALERNLRTEAQLNRRVELRRTLRTKQAELEQQR